MGVAPTGSGKSIICALITRYAHARREPVVISAHRDVLVSQLSLSLARAGLLHGLLCSPSSMRFIRDLHVKKLGRCFVHDTSGVLVSSVDTMARRALPWAPNVKLWIGDEAHHYQPNNKWGKQVAQFYNARGLGLTATPIRTDGKGFVDIFNYMVEGPNLRELIDLKRLCEYRMVVPPSAQQVREDMRAVASIGGDYAVAPTEAVLKKRQIMGDIVGHYKQFAQQPDGTYLRGITFGTSIDACIAIAAAYNAAGVRAMALSSKDSDSIRWAALDDFNAGKLDQIVNCDLFGEGFDVPGVCVVSMCRPTQSYSLYCQQFGRALRVLEGKERAIIIDHVGNFWAHGGPPDFGPHGGWTLEPRPKKSKETREREERDLMGRITTCSNPACMAPYTLPALVCPECGEPYTPRARIVRAVDGQLKELTADMLATLRDQRMKVFESPSETLPRLLRSGMPRHAATTAADMHAVRHSAHMRLQKAMDLWATPGYHGNRPVESVQAEFKMMFKIDPRRAIALSGPEAAKLAERVELDTYLKFNEMSVVHVT